jgi:hypothetical protein
MQIHFVDVLKVTAALLAGGLIGYTFGVIQNLALRKNRKLQEGGQLNNGWAVMPGSGKRVATLVIALVLIQFICPLLFVDGFQWFVSGGVVLGYGAVLYRQLRERQAGKA